MADWLSNSFIMLSKPPPDLDIRSSAGAEIPDTDEKVLPQVHKGFGFAAARLKEHVFRNIAEWRKQSDLNRRVVFTGHSLGAAVATLLAVAYRSAEAGAATPLVTFGGPRVGNAALNQWVEAHTAHTQVMAEGDTVAAVPTLDGYVAPYAVRHWQLGRPQQLANQCTSDESQDPAGPVPFVLVYGFVRFHKFTRYMALLALHYKRLTQTGEHGTEGAAA